MRRQVISILVENTPGVLSHVSGLFSRRAFNIDSFSAGVTADPRYTRMTIVASGDDLTLDQIEKQVAKLEDVVDIKVLEPNNSISRELMMVKISYKSNEINNITALVKDIYHGKIVDIQQDSMLIEITGNPDKLQSFLDMLGDNEILELARTGVTGLSRGAEDVVKL
ncbi:MAG: acetolactate synthase small subunit [Lachnospiraceae bacterium]|nr:acetolactate synthase small subunit [Lachnospiraceae bacterium]